MKTKSVVALFLLVLSNTSSVRGQTLEWTRQLGTSEFDSSEDVSADGLGNVYISGFTKGNPGGNNAGREDAFLSKSALSEKTRKIGIH